MTIQRSNRQKKTDNCRCVCVKKKKKERKPKPQKQKALVNNYNNQIPIINMESRQTSFKGPQPAKKYSVFKPKTQMIEKVKSSKILTPLIKPPRPISRIESTRLKRQAAERRLEQTIMEMDTQTRPRPSVAVPTTPTSIERPIDRRRPQPSEARPFQRVSGRPGRQLASTVSRSVFADTGSGAGASSELD